MLKVILFDMDGVLIDSEGYYAEGTYTWMKEIGFQGKIEDIHKLIGTTMDKTYDMLVDLLGKKISKEAVKERNEAYFRQNPFNYKEGLKEGVTETMKWLKLQGISCAICSSSPLATIEKVVDQCGLSEYVSFYLSGENFKESKPHPEIYLTAAARFGVEPKECIVIEDSTMGIQAGKNAGMPVIAIMDERFDLDQSQADYRVNSMHIAKDVVEQNYLKKM